MAWLGVNVCEWCPVTSLLCGSVFMPHIKCSWDMVQIYYNPEQDKSAPGNNVEISGPEWLTINYNQLQYCVFRFYIYSHYFGSVAILDWILHEIMAIQLM